MNYNFTEESSKNRSIAQIFGGYFQYLGFTPNDIKKVEEKMSRDQTSYGYPNIAVPFTYLASKSKQQTPKKLLKCLRQRLEGEGFEVVCDGFKTLSSIKIYDKVAKCDVIPKLDSKVIKFRQLVDSFNLENFPDESVGLLSLWFIFIYMTYLMQMDGDDIPFLLCKDLLVDGQPIVIRRAGNKIIFKVIHVYSPKPEELSREFYKKLAVIH